MPIDVSVDLRLSTRDPREAVSECLTRVRAGASNVDDLQVQLAWLSMADLRLLLTLAERLGPDAPGFRSPPNTQSVSARDFIARPAAPASFQGMLTESMPAGDALALVEQLLESPPRAVRSTMFTLIFQNVRWKAAPLASTGTLRLLDLKAFNRAQRFSLTASVQLPGEDPASPELLALVRQIAEASGIAFDQGAIARSIGADEVRSVTYTKAVLAGQIAFDEAVEDIADGLPAGWVSHRAKSALPPHDAFQRRAGHLMSGATGRVSFLPMLKRAVRQTLPSLTFESSDAEQVLYRAVIAPGSELLVSVRKESRLGKAFSLAVGVRSPERQVDFMTGIFMFERSTDEKVWTYSDPAEAQSAVDEAVALAAELLPRVETALRRWFTPWPAELSPEIEEHGPFTAKEAFALADPLARQRFPDARLVRIENQARSLVVRNVDGPELTFDGRLSANSAWSFQFHSPAHDTLVEIVVPACGRVRVLGRGRPFQDEYARRFLVPISGVWMDSDRAFALVEAQGGRERRESAPPFGVVARLWAFDAQRPYWAIRYLVFDGRERNDFQVALDAETGEVMDGRTGAF